MIIDTHHMIKYNGQIRTVNTIFGYKILVFNLFLINYICPKKSLAFRLLWALLKAIKEAPGVCFVEKSWDV